MKLNILLGSNEVEFNVPDIHGSKIQEVLGLFLDCGSISLGFEIRTGHLGFEF